jgi:hypothetical protein
LGFLRSTVRWLPKETDPDAWKKYVYPIEIDDNTHELAIDPNITCHLLGAFLLNDGSRLISQRYFQRTPVIRHMIKKN